MGRGCRLRSSCSLCFGVLVGSEEGCWEGEEGRIWWVGAGRGVEDVRSVGTCGVLVWFGHWNVVRISHPIQIVIF